LNFFIKLIEFPTHLSASKTSNFISKAVGMDYWVIPLVASSNFGFLKLIDIALNISFEF
jgi:hypothetical protein